MDLGEKLIAIQEIIFSKAKGELDTAGINDSLAVIVMENVFHRFQESALSTVTLHLLEKESQATRNGNLIEPTEAANE